MSYQLITDQFGDRQESGKCGSERLNVLAAGKLKLSLSELS